MANSQLLLTFAAAARGGIVVGRHDMGDPAAAPAGRTGKAERALFSSHSDPAGRGHRGRSRPRWSLPQLSIALAGTGDVKIPVAVFGATLFIAAVGFADDVRPIPVLPRLLLQGAAVAAVILAAPENLRIVPACPLWLERALLLLAGLWFVNLVNFMDGLDLMTVGRDRADHRRGRSAWLARRTSGIDNHGRRGAVRRDARICAFQPAGGEDLSRRRRQPADRPVGRLVPAAARLASAIRRRPAVAALLSGRRDRHAVAADGEARAVLGGASHRTSTSAPPTTAFRCGAW